MTTDQREAVHHARLLGCITASEFLAALNDEDMAEEIRTGLAHPVESFEEVTVVRGG